MRGQGRYALLDGTAEQALFQLTHELEPHSLVRVKNVVLYLTAVDQNGQEVCRNGKAVWNGFPYRSAANDLDGGGGAMPALVPSPNGATAHLTP
jgi:hypothetical protein